MLTDTEGNPEIKIVKFTGYTEIDDADGTENETINVHFSDGSMIEFDTLERAVFITRTYQPVSPDWFVIEVNGDADAEEQAEIEEQRKAKIEAERKAKARLDLITEIKTKIPSRPIDAYTDQELMAKVSGAPLGVAEDVLINLRGQPCENGGKHSQADAENFGASVRLGRRKSSRRLNSASDLRGFTQRRRKSLRLRTSPT